MKFMRSAAVAACLLAPSAVMANCVPPEDTFASASTFATSGTLVTANAAEPCALALNDAAATAPGPKRLRVEPAKPAYAVGDAFPVYQHNILIDPPRYGLPPVNGNWRYYRADGHTYKVDAQSFAVMDIVDEGNLALLN